jgi:hypothetical protein
MPGSRSAAGGLHRPRRGRAVQEEVVTDPGVQVGQDDRPAVGDEADVVEDRLAEDGVHRRAVVADPLGLRVGVVRAVRG